MTPNEFLALCQLSINDMALFFAGTPDHYVQESLAAFGERIRKRWLERFEFVPREAVDGAVRGVVARVRARKTRN